MQCYRLASAAESQDGEFTSLSYMHMHAQDPGHIRPLKPAWASVIRPVHAGEAAVYTPERDFRSEPLY